MGVREVYKFGEYVLDVADRRLSRADSAIALAPKAHDVLVALVRRAGRLVTKQEPRVHELIGRGRGHLMTASMSELPRP